jgi:hypothetical protein
MSQINKNKKYAISEKTPIVQKVVNVVDRDILKSKAVSIVSAIKAKHLS